MMTKKEQEELPTDIFAELNGMNKENEMTKKVTVPQSIKDKLQTIRSSNFPLNDLIATEDSGGALGFYIGDEQKVSNEDERLILLYLSGSDDVELVAEGADLKAGDEVVLPDGSSFTLDTDISLSGSVTNE